MSNLQSVVCPNPFTSFHINLNGEVSNCCTSWLSKGIGNIKQSSLLELYSQENSIEIRKSILDGSYKYCSHTLCPEISMRQLGNLNPIGFESKSDTANIYNCGALPPLDREIHVHLSYDQSCNLSCPSCRNGLILYSKKNIPSGVEESHSRAVASIDELLMLGYKVSVNVTGAGDPFASPLYWEYLSKIQYHPNLSIRLFTNGVLMTENRLSPSLRSILKYVTISVDASTEETYAKVRKGGNFNSVRKNVKKFDEMINNGLVPNLYGWWLNFIVQAENFREIVPFVNWALSHSSLRYVWFNLITDWGHLDDITFKSKAIWRTDHPEHAEFLEVLKDPILLGPKIFLGNLSNFINRK